MMFICQSAFLQNNNISSPLVQVAGSVWYGESYCLGTPPTKYPESYPNQLFYIYSGGINDTSHTFLYTFSSDQKGNFSLDLLEGIYTISLSPIEYIDYNSIMESKKKTIK